MRRTRILPFWWGPSYTLQMEDSLRAWFFNLIILMCPWICFANIWLRIFASMFVRDNNLIIEFSFPVISLTDVISSYALISSPSCSIYEKVKALVSRSSSALCDLMDGSPPGYSVCGILQARISELVAISFSSLNPRIEPDSPVL